MTLSEKFPKLLDLATEIDNLETVRDKILDSGQRDCLLKFSSGSQQPDIELDSSRITSDVTHFVVAEINSTIEELKSVMYTKMYPHINKGV